MKYANAREVLENVTIHHVKSRPAFIDIPRSPRDAARTEGEPPTYDCGKTRYYLWRRSSGDEVAFARDYRRGRGHFKGHTFMLG